MNACRSSQSGTHMLQAAPKSIQMTTHCLLGLEGVPWLHSSQSSCQKILLFNRANLPLVDRGEKPPVTLSCHSEWYSILSSMKLAQGGKLSQQLPMLLLILQSARSQILVLSKLHPSPALTSQNTSIWCVNYFIQSPRHTFNCLWHSDLPNTHDPTQDCSFSSTGKATGTRYHNDRWLTDLVRLIGAWYYCKVCIFHALQVYFASLKSEQ